MKRYKVNCRFCGMSSIVEETGAVKKDPPNCCPYCGEEEERTIALLRRKSGRETTESETTSVKGKPLQRLSFQVGESTSLCFILEYFAGRVAEVKRLIGEVDCWQVTLNLEVDEDREDRNELPHGRAVAGEKIEAGDAVYWSADDGKLYKAGARTLKPGDVVDWNADERVTLQRTRVWCLRISLASEGSDGVTVKETRWKTCPRCDGNKWVSTLFGGSDTCPACKGSGLTEVVD